MKCYKCNGKGFIPGFAHVSEGVCFDCFGSGVLPETKKHTVKFAVSYVKQFYQSGYFSTDISGSLKQISVINNSGHQTAEKMLMEDDQYLYIGQPVCEASGWFKFPKDIKDEFIKHYAKTHFGKYDKI